MFQVKETLNTAESLLGDLSGFKGFKREASDLAEELQSYCKDQFESWVSEMMTAIDDPKQPLRYSLGCHCCSIMYVGLQYLKGYLSFKGGGLQYICIYSCFEKGCQTKCARDNPER